MIELLVTIHDREHADAATDERVDFRLREARTPELLMELCQRFPAQTTELKACGPLIRLASERSLEVLRASLDAEVRAEKGRNRDYWEPLRRELEPVRCDHRNP